MTKIHARHMGRRDKFFWLALFIPLTLSVSCLRADLRTRVLQAARDEYTKKDPNGTEFDSIVAEGEGNRPGLLLLAFDPDEQVRLEAIGILAHLPEGLDGFDMRRYFTKYPLTTDSGSRDVLTACVLSARSPSEKIFLTCFAAPKANIDAIEIYCYWDPRFIAGLIERRELPAQALVYVRAYVKKRRSPDIKAALRKVARGSSGK